MSFLISFEFTQKNMSLHFNDIILHILLDASLFHAIRSDGNWNKWRAPTHYVIIASEATIENTFVFF